MANDNRRAFRGAEATPADVAVGITAGLDGRWRAGVEEDDVRSVERFGNARRTGRRGDRHRENHTADRGYEIRADGGAFGGLGTFEIVRVAGGFRRGVFERRCGSLG